MDITEEELRLEAEALELELSLPEQPAPIEESAIEDYDEEESALFDEDIEESEEEPEEDAEQEDTYRINVLLYTGEVVRLTIEEFNNNYTELHDESYCLNDEAVYCEEENVYEHESRYLFIHHYYGRDGYHTTDIDVSHIFYNRRFSLTIDDEKYLFDNVDIAIENGFDIPTTDNTYDATSNIDNFKYKNIVLEQTRLFYGDNFEFNTKEKFKFNYYFGTNVKYLLVIKFPIIKIRNSNNQEHLIEDLYVILPFFEDRVKTILYGVRETCSKIEVFKNYQHSHLNDSLGNVTSFCLGSGDISIILSSCASNFNELNFGALLATIKFYVEWESLEGGPYRWINNIRNKEMVNIVNMSVSYNITLLTFLMVNIKHLKIKVNNLIEIDEKSVFSFITKIIKIYIEGKLSSNIISHLDYLIKTNILFLDENNEYYKIIDMNQSVTINEIPIMTYKNEIIISKITESPIEEVKINYDTACFNPNIVYATITEFNKRINHQYFTETEV